MLDYNSVTVFIKCDMLYIVINVQVSNVYLGCMCATGVIVYIILPKNINVQSEDSGDSVRYTIVSA